MGSSGRRRHRPGEDSLNDMHESSSSPLDDKDDERFVFMAGQSCTATAPVRIDTVYMEPSAVRTCVASGKSNIISKRSTQRASTCPCFPAEFIEPRASDPTIVGADGEASLSAEACHGAGHRGRRAQRRRWAAHRRRRRRRCSKRVSTLGGHGFRTSLCKLS
jgi:hypothetical protein